MATTTVKSINVASDDGVELIIKTTLNEGGIEASIESGHIIKPGDDYSNEDPKVQLICAAVHTPEVVAAYQAMQAANKP